jgi:hypothetical protein
MITMQEPYARAVQNLIRHRLGRRHVSDVHVGLPRQRRGSDFVKRILVRDHDTKYSEAA